MLRKSALARFLSLVRLRAGGRAVAVVLRTDTQILWICVLAVLPIGDAIAIGLDRYWDERNVETAFSPKNRHGTNPVHQAMPVGVRRDALGDADAAKAEAAGSGNFLLTVPILNLPGRGLDLSLALTYNSQIWHDGGTIHFDPDHGWPAPGWSLGFGKLVRMEAADPQLPIAMLIDSDGTRHPFSGPPAQKTFSAHTTDGSLIDYTVDFARSPPRGNYGIDSAVVRYPNGTVILYTAPGDNRGFGQFASEIFPTRITDADGNYISITYRNGSGPAIDAITDTLGRKVSFHYDANNALTAISGPSLNGGTRVLIRLHYASFEFNADPSRPFSRSTRSFIDAIFYPADSTGYWFDDPDSYSMNGILKVVSQRRHMYLAATSLTEQGTFLSTGTITRQRTYNYPGSATGPFARPTKLPTYSTMVESWSDMDSVPAPTTYAILQVPEGQLTEIKYPDGGRYKLLTAKDGLASQTVRYDAGNKVLRISTLLWEKGWLGSNRVKRVETGDELGQGTAQEFSYGPTKNQIVDTWEYDYGGTNLLRRVHTDYVVEPTEQKNLVTKYARKIGGRLCTTEPRDFAAT